MSKAPGATWYLAILASLTTASVDGLVATLWAAVAISLFSIHAIIDHKVTLDRGIEIRKRVGARHPDLYGPGGRFEAHDS